MPPPEELHPADNRGNAFVGIFLGLCFACTGTRRLRREKVAARAISKLTDSVRCIPTHLFCQAIVHRLQLGFGPISSRDALEVSTEVQGSFHGVVKARG